MWRSNQLSYRTVSGLSAWNLASYYLFKQVRVQEARVKLPNFLIKMSSLRCLGILLSAFFGDNLMIIELWRAEHSRKEVFQPHLPVRLPCYDLAPITSFTLGRPSRSQTSGAPGFHGLTGGVYKARERIHRAMADARLLANPASWGRVADPSPNYDALY